MRATVDINCDVGEGVANESLLMPYISSCSIACGGHAGDENTIVKTIKLAIKNNVAIGAHPSFPDKVSFGREIMQMSSIALQQSIENQINLVKRSAESLGVKLHHVKAHGALYNLVANDKQTAQILIDAVLSSVKEAYLYVPYKSKISEMAMRSGLKVKQEAFADRNYQTNLTLVSRKETNAVITKKELVFKHLIKMICDNKLVSVDGVEVEIKAETFCVHGDTKNALEILKYLSQELNKKGIKIA